MADRRYIFIRIFGGSTIILTLVGIALFSGEKSKENSYIKSICLIVDWDVQQKSCKGNNCYASVWLVDYDNISIQVNDIRERRRITGMYSYQYSKASE
ncbi:hypothetical protein I4U23_016335 [Adineta vaga]|nr:hypothetical protein I4U23_016335 [Adineta vaga]